MKTFVTKIFSEKNQYRKILVQEVQEGLRFDYIDIRPLEARVLLWVLSFLI
jgi:hypothetical protein